MKKVWLFLFLAVAALLFPPTVWGQGPGPEVDTGTTAWMLTSTALVLLMIPGWPCFYGGLVRTKNVLGTMMHCFAAMAIVGVLWVGCGYSLSFGPNVLWGWFGWDSRYLFLRGIDDTVMEAGIPEYVFAMFQGKFAIIAPALIAGAFAERVRFKGYCLFITLWRPDRLQPALPLGVGRGWLPIQPRCQRSHRLCGAARSSISPPASALWWWSSIWVSVEAIRNRPCIPATWSSPWWARACCGWAGSDSTQAVR